MLKVNGPELKRQTTLERRRLSSWQVEINHIRPELVIETAREMAEAGQQATKEADAKAIQTELMQPVQTSGEIKSIYQGTVAELVWAYWRQRAGMRVDTADRWNSIGQMVRSRIQAVGHAKRGWNPAIEAYGGSPTGPGGRGRATFHHSTATARFSNDVRYLSFRQFWLKRYVVDVGSRSIARLSSERFQQSAKRANVPVT